MDLTNGLDLVALMNPQPKQAQALQILLKPECKYLLYGGAMAGGKSYLLRWAALYYLLYLYEKTNIHHIPVGLFSEDYPTLKDRQITRIKREFPPELGELKETKEEGFAFFLHPEYGGGRILLRNLDDPSKYMSSEFAGIFVEELTRNDELTFQDLRNRLRYPGVEAVKFMGASNPGGVGHGWVRKYFIDSNSDDPEQERFFYVHANVYDNTFISPTYIKQLESLPEQKRLAYLEGSWDVFAGQYFNEFSRSTHVVPGFIPHKKKFKMFVGGLDWGREKPFSCHIAGIQHKSFDGENFYRAWTFLELYGTNKRPAEWGEELVSKLAQYELSLDDIHFIQADTQIFVKGIDLSKAIKDQFVDADERYISILRPASKDRIGGWENLHNWLSLAPDGQPYWYITEDCKNLIRTLPQLVHDESKVEDVDTDSEDHAGDDQRYMFKALKWLDGRVGGVGKTMPKHKMMPLAVMQDGRQVSMDLDKFASAWYNQIGKYRRR